MKKTITLSFLVLALFTYSQSPIKYILDNTRDVRSLSDSIALNAKTHYKFSSESIIKTNGYQVLYKNISDTTDIMSIMFSIRMKGANKDLEILGTPKYFFNHVEGRYLDLFPFWKCFVNPSEDIESLSKKGVTYIRNGQERLIFSGNNDYWILSFKDY